MAFTDLVLGRKEFDKQYEISVIIASALLIPSIFLYLLQFVLSKDMAISASLFIFNPTGSLENILPQSSILLTISIIIPILMSSALFLFIHKLSDTTIKVPSIIACILLAISPFILYITALVAYILFFLILKRKRKG